MVESTEEMTRELERLRSENAALKARPERSTRLQVSAKGGVSLYGIRRFPVTFYMEEWERIFDKTERIRAFIRENEAALKRRTDTGQESGS